MFKSKAHNIFTENISKIAYVQMMMREDKCVIE